MSTPKISFKVPSAQDAAAASGPAEDAEIAGGDVAAHDLSSAPGKEREREPVYGGDIANISTNLNDNESMDVDAANGGAYPCCLARYARGCITGITGRGRRVGRSNPTLIAPL